MSKALVLFSGGQDSTTCLYLAKTIFDNVFAVNISYGQRHSSELGAADKISELADVTLRRFVFDTFQQIGDSALVRIDQAIKESGGYQDNQCYAGLPTSFVPGRNMMFLGIAASYAVHLGIKDIVTGVCETDFSGYPDCRREFIDAMEKAITLAMPSSAGPIKIHTPLMWINKAETVRLARRLPGCWKALAHTVTCYHGQSPGCGECPACVLRRQGFEEAGYPDPAMKGDNDGGGVQGH